MQPSCIGHWPLLAAVSAEPMPESPRARDHSRATSQAGLAALSTTITTIQPALIAEVVKPWGPHRGKCARAKGSGFLCVLQAAAVAAAVVDPELVCLETDSVLFTDPGFKCAAAMFILIP